MPSGSPSLHSARDDDDEGHERAQLDSDVEGEEEANGSPHVTEAFVGLAVFSTRKLGVFGLIGDVRVAAVESVRHFAPVVVLATIRQVLARSGSEQAGELTGSKLIHRGM